MEEMAKPKPQKKSTSRETAPKNRARTAAKPSGSKEPAAETSPKNTDQTSIGDGEHLSITPPAQTKKVAAHGCSHFFIDRNRRRRAPYLATLEALCNGLCTRWFEYCVCGSAGR